MHPIILDFDQSVSTMPGASVVSLIRWQEDIRFGCSMRRLRELDTVLHHELPLVHGPAFLGSGDFHHVSYLLIRRALRRSNLRLVVLDNHPDNMRFPFGIHCGSWVSHVAALPGVTHIDVVGITSKDVSARGLWENRWRPLLSGKLTYWCIGTDTRWARRLGLGGAFKVAGSADELIQSFVQASRGDERVYLSIDKDVLHPDVAHTNWDQGLLRETHVDAVISALGDRIAGADITGDVSLHRYHTWWKRWLSHLDDQPVIALSMLEEWQRSQNEINARLVARLQRL